MKKLAAFALALGLIVPVAVGTARIEKPEAAELTVVTEGGDYDVVVYGATSAGVTAAIAAKREGADVLLIAQNDLIGGLTSSGLGATDMANKGVVGGISYEFYNRIYEYYLDDSAWTSQTREKYFEELGKDIYSGKNDTLQMQWVFEPKVAEQVFIDMLIEDNVPVIFNERIDLEEGVTTDESGTRIESLVTESGKEFTAKVFIDCSYEGDLMAEAGVTYTIGREANDEYGETMNGILPNNNEIELVSPYIVEGDRNSGLLPFIEDSALGTTGEADSRVQAYCFRFTLSTDPENRLPITKPANYHPEWYESRARIFLNNPEAPCELTLSKMPNNKTDTNHADFVGMSYEYADGDYLSRKNIEDDHRDYVLGLLYFYAYDERVPMAIRQEIRNYGLALDEFTDNGNFPVNIYLREGRRMVSDYVMKESDVITASVPGVIQKTTAPYSVGQGFYWFDSHRVAYYVYDMGENASDDGFQTDGNFWKSRRDYPISYESIRPKKEECVNLFVPVCLSSTHAAYGSIRMETTYMIVAESAGTAAAMSVQEMETNADFCVQDLNYADLAVKLSENGQLLGDIVAPDIPEGELSVLKLCVSGVIDSSSADTLYEALRTDGFNTTERVLAVRDVMYAAAKRIDKYATVGETAEILNKFGMIGNVAEWTALFSETPPAGLSQQNVIGVFNAIAEFFAVESPEGYITDWVNYFYDNNIIDAELRDYFDDNAVSGRACETAKTRTLLMAIARTLEPSVSDGTTALQVYVSAGMIGNTAAWTGIFDGTAASVSGSNLNALLKKVYPYMVSNESKWQGRIGTACLDFLVSAGILDESDTATYTALLSGTSDSTTVEAATAKAVIVSGARYFNGAATETDALQILTEKGVDTSALSSVMQGTPAQGSAMRAFLSALQTAIIENPIIDPMTQEDFAQAVSLNILTQDQADSLIENAVFGGNVQSLELTDLLSKISARLTVSGDTYIVKLFNAGILDESQKALLEEGGETVAGDVANMILRSALTYVAENNVSLSAANSTFLTGKNIITQEEAAQLNTFSTFGFAPKALVQKIFIGLARYIDPNVTEDLGDALSLLKDINAVGNVDGWTEQFTGELLNGKDCLNVLNVAIAFADEDGTLEDYRYLAEKGYISSEDATYYVRHANNSNTAIRTKIVDLMIAMAKGMDTDGSVTDGASAVAEIVENKVISNSTAWLAIVNSTDETIVVADVINLVDKCVAKLKVLEDMQGDVEYLSDEVLDWFVAQGYILSGNYDKEYFLSQANSAISAVSNVGETKNMLTRAFRGVTGSNKYTSGSALTKKITETSFTFSDDPQEDTTLRASWYGLLEASSVVGMTVNGNDLRVLMNRIYDYMNPEV